MRILFYETPYYVFSNWSAHMVEYKGVLYTTAEHAYHTQRFEDKEIKERICGAKSPFEAKKIAHDNIEKQIKDWDEKRVTVMEAIIRAKIQQHQEVKDILLSTKGEQIVENSPYDYFWGIGRDGTGRNELGKIWVKMREETTRIH